MCSCKLDDPAAAPVPHWNRIVAFVDMSISFANIAALVLRADC
jgi:hypothetical protein